jgi:protein-S-isoprenylcysteine O-methyltransferase Ste14
MTEADSKKTYTSFLLTKMAIFTIAVPGSVTVWMPLYWLFPWLRRAITPNHWCQALASALILIGAWGYFWCALDFVLRGRGTPAPIDPPKVLVVQGLYKYTRNPMYVSVLTVLAGECVLFRSVILLEYVVLVALGFHVFVMLYEEPALTRKMGDAYEQYRDEVPRWIPRFWRRRTNRAV